MPLERDALAADERPVVPVERGRVDRQLRELALEHAAGHLDDTAYLAQSAALRNQWTEPWHGCGRSAMRSDWLTYQQRDQT
jgi:hypothetical protein